MSHRARSRGKKLYNVHIVHWSLWSALESILDLIVLDQSEVDSIAI